MTVTLRQDQTKSIATVQNAQHRPFSSLSHDACPDVKAVYLLIAKAFFISGVLSWFLIACPAVVAEESPVSALATTAFSQAYIANEANFGATAYGTGQNGFAWQQQNQIWFQSADTLHEGVQRLRQALSAWWASKPQQSAIASQVKDIMAASGDGPYAAWSYNIGASSKSLELKIKYEF